MSRKSYKLYLFVMGLITLLEIVTALGLNIKTVRNPIPFVVAVWFGSVLWITVTIFSWSKTFKKIGTKVDLVISLFVTFGLYVSIAGTYVHYLSRLGLWANALLFLIVFVSSVRSFLKKEKKIHEMKRRIRVEEKKYTINTEISKN